MSEPTREQKQIVSRALENRFLVQLDVALTLMRQGTPMAVQRARAALEQADATLQTLYHFDLERYAALDRQFVEALADLEKRTVTEATA